MKIKIYSGLSLDEKTVKRFFPDAETCGPIKRSDLIGDIKRQVHVVGIVDGEFLQSRAVSPTDIMDALRCGLKVYGSSSMGAIRAAELDSYGMIGCGKIYEFIKRTPYFKDDHLGLVFYKGYSAFNYAYLDFVFGLEQLCSDGEISTGDLRTLIRYYKKLHFSERNMHTLKMRISNESSHPANMVKLLDKITKKIKSTKTADGIVLLKKIKNDIRQNQKTNYSLSSRLQYAPARD